MASSGMKDCYAPRKIDTVNLLAQTPTLALARALQRGRLMKLAHQSMTVTDPVTAWWKVVQVQPSAREVRNRCGAGRRCDSLRLTADVLQRQICGTSQWNNGATECAPCRRHGRHPIRSAKAFFLEPTLTVQSACIRP